MGFKQSFLRKFIFYLKKRPIEPKQLTIEAQKKIISFYVELRRIYRDKSGLPITVRTLESGIRLSSANAKLCLDNYRVNEDDIAVAEMIMRAAILGKNWDPVAEISEPSNLNDGVLKQALS